MSDKDMIFALYVDGDPQRPNEDGIFMGLAVVLDAMIKLKGREHTAELLAGIAEQVRNPTWSPQVIIGGKG